MALRIVWKELGENPSEDHSEDIKADIFKLLLNLIKLHNIKGPTDVFHMSEYESCEMIELWCKKLQFNAVSLVLSRWNDIATFFRCMYRGVDKVIDAMMNALTTEFPPSSIIDSFYEYLRGNFKHTADSCRVIDLFKQNDEHLEGALAEAMRNKDNYTPGALLYVAEMYHTKQSMKIPEDLIFSKQVEEAIIIALKGMFLDKNTEDFSNSRSWTLDGRFLPYGAACIRREVEWVFKGLLAKPAIMVENCYQFEEIMSLAVETFSDDLNTMVAICSLSADSILDKCKDLFGEHIIRSVRSRIFEKLAVLRNRPRVYEEFNRQMRCVEEYFSSYTVDGKAAYEQLCMDIKRKHKRKRKLMSVLDMNN